MIAAGADFAFERNSSALAIAHDEGPRVIVDRLHEWRPKRDALVPSHVFAAVGMLVSSLGGAAIMADAWYRQSAVEGLAPYRVALRAAPASTHAWEPFAELRRMLAEDVVDLSRIAYGPGVDAARLAKQLAAVRATDGSHGALKITIEQARDGTHGDLVSALVLATWQLRHARQAARVASGRLEGRGRGGAR